MTTRQVSSVVVPSASCLPGNPGSRVTRTFAHRQDLIPNAYHFRLPHRPRRRNRHPHDTHTVAVISDTGRHIATDTFPATNPGYVAISEFMATYGVTTVGVEGTSSYGAGLTRHLRTQKYSVVEVLRPTRAVRRRDGKSDPVDAVAAARQVLTGEALSIPKDTSGPVESLRGLQITRRQLVMTAAKLMTTIKSLLVTAPDEIRRRYSAMSTLVMVEALSRCRPSADLADPEMGCSSR
ncbi:transposase-like protein [Corynebacterium striatum]|nr:transposase-like protein [Corynebacterium striatum]